MTMDATVQERTSRRTRSRRTVARAHALSRQKKAKAKARVKPKSKRAQAERIVAAKASSRTPMLSFRMDTETRDLVDHAATLAGQNRTDFMVTVLREKAVEVILNQRLFVLNDADWSAFVERLDNPPAPNSKLKALLSRVPIWDK